LPEPSNELAHSTGWKEFYATVVDLRGSAAMAGQAVVRTGAGGCSHSAARGAGK
jgi:hypothetical protein